MYDICWSMINDQLLIIGYDHWSCYDQLLIIRYDYWSLPWSTVDHMLWLLIIALINCWSYAMIIDHSYEEAVDHTWCMTLSCHDESYRDHYPGGAWSKASSTWPLTSTWWTKRPSRWCPAELPILLSDYMMILNLSWVDKYMRQKLRLRNGLGKRSRLQQWGRSAATSTTCSRESLW